MDAKAPPAPAVATNRLPSWITAGSTPDRLRLLAVVTVLVIVATGVVTWLLTDRLVSETAAAADGTGEVLVATQQISASFAEADAAAVSVHLAGSDGNREQSRLFEQAMDRGSASLERVARLVGDDEASHTALQDIAAASTQYSRLIEAARVASVQGLPDADQTLQEASDLNRTAISPDVELIAERARTRFDDETSSTWYLVALGMMLIPLIVLLVAQLWLQRRFNRLLNIPLAIATLVMLAVLVLTARSYLTQQSAFTDADVQAFDSIQTSGQIQELAYNHRSLSTSAVLAGRASENLESLEAALEGETSLLQQAIASSSTTRKRAVAEEVAARWERYVAENRLSQIALQAGDLNEAQEVTQGAANSAFNGFNTAVEAALLDNREQFLGELQTASDALKWMRARIVVGALLATLLAWWGYALRIGEYR